MNLQKIAELPRSVESRRDPSAPTPLRGSGVHSQVVAYPVIGCADGSCRLHSRSRLTNPSPRNRNATRNSALLGGDHAGVLQVGVRAFRGPFAALSTPQFTNIFRFYNAFRDLLTLYSAPLLFFLRFSFFCSIHRGRPRQLYRSWYFPFFGRLPPTSVRSLGGIGSHVFYFTSSLALSRNFLKFPIYLCPTRVNFSTASSITLPHPEEGAALLRGRLSPFLFGVSFSTGPSRSFRSASSTGLY